jgi:hypothetical protein
MPVLTGHMVLVLTLSGLMHLVTHDHDHDLSMYSFAGEVSVEMDHERHDSHDTDPTDLHSEPSHEFSLNGDYTFSLVKKMLQHNDQLVVLSVAVDKGLIVRSGQTLAYSVFDKDPPDRAPDRSVILRI